MRQILLFLLLTGCFNIVRAENQDSTWIVDHYAKQERFITMRDGVKLFTSIYIPTDRTEKHPILITRTPYSCAPYGENHFRKFWSNHYKEYCRENYILVIQDVRGKYMSEGEFIDVRPFNPTKKSNQDIDEASDAYDTIDWLIKNMEGNNGRVGVFGTSYPGFYATQAALCRHPNLFAVSPQAPVTDWFMGDDWHHNGALFLLDAFSFYGTGGFGINRRQPDRNGAKSGIVIPVKDSYDFFLRTGAIPNFTKLTGDSIKFWNDLMSHPNYDDWWKKRSVPSVCFNIKPAVLVVGGLFDAEDCYGAWNTYKAIEKQCPATDNRLVMGPWSHGQWNSTDGSHLGHIEFGSNTVAWYTENIEKPFFDYYLKGKGSVDRIKEATVFFSGENKWEQFEQWPPAEVKEKSLYLGADNKLCWEKSVTPQPQFSEYISDPSKPVLHADGIITRKNPEYMTDDQRFAARRTDVLVFETEELTGDITLAGPLAADLKVSISTTDADFVVKVIDVFPNDFKYKGKNGYVMGGYQMLVRGDVFRGRYRNSFEKPEPFIPGKIEEVKFEMPDVAHVFKKGHRIMVQIQSSWFPLVDRNPQTFTNIYEANDSDFKKSTIRIYHDKTNFSKIILPVLGR